MFRNVFPPMLNIVLNPHRYLIYEFTVVCQGKLTHRITEVTKKISNSFNQEHLEHLVEHRISPVYPAFASPLSSRHPASSIPMDIEGEKQAHYGIRKESTKGVRCMYTFCTILYTDC
jgi:hypothetical protein